MALPFKNSFITRLLSRLFKYGFFIISAAVLLIVVIVALIPLGISTDLSHDFIEQTISNALNRSVRIERLDWSWKRGIRIDRFVIPDDPEFSVNPLLFIERVQLKPNVKKLLRREVDIDLHVSRIDINIIKNTRGVHNIETLVGKKGIEENAAVPFEKENGARKAGEEFLFALPSIIEDIIAEIHLEKINITYDDRAKSETFWMKDLEIELSTTSLKRSTVNLSMGADIKVNNHALPRSTITASIKNLFDDNGVLCIEKSSVALGAKLPGIDATTNAKLAESKATAHIRIDLASAVKAFAPLVPDTPASIKVKGVLECDVAAGIDPADPLAFDVKITGSDLSISGKPVYHAIIGPGDFSVNANGIVDLEADTFKLKAGKIGILENSHIQATAMVEQIKSDNRKVQLLISDLFLDLDEIVSFAKPLLPSTIKIKKSSAENAALSIHQARIDGDIPSGPLAFQVEGMNIRLPDMAITDEMNGDSVLQLSGGRFKIEALTMQLMDLFPVSAAATTSLMIDDVSGNRENQALSISGIRLDRLNVDINHVMRNDNTRFGFTGGLTVDHQLEIDRVQLSDFFRIDQFRHSLKAKGDIRTNDTIHASLDFMDVTVKRVSIEKKELGLIKTGMAIHATSGDIVVNNLNPIDVDAQDVQVDVSLEKAIELTLSANIYHSSDPLLDLDLTLNSDIDALIDKIPPKFQRGITGKGVLQLTLTAAGRQPKKREIAAISKMEFEDNLSFIDRFSLDVGVEKATLAIPFSDNNQIDIHSINAQPLFSYKLDGTTGKGKLSGTATAGAITGLPGTKLKEPISCRFSFSGEHEFLNTIALRHSLSESLVEIKETAEIKLTGLDRILTQKPFPGLPELLTTLGADISTTISIPECQRLKKLGFPILSDMDISGFSKVGLKFKLNPDRSIGAGLVVEVKGMDLFLPEQISVHQLDANFDFSKYFAIDRPNKTDLILEVPDLSLKVIESERQTNPISKDRLIHRHIRKLHERMNPDPALTFQKAEVMAAPFPLVMDNSIVMLNLEKGLPNLDFFQLNCLGGTLNGSLSLVGDKKNKQRDFAVNTSLTFSGLDTAQLFPQSVSKKKPFETAISGSLYADFPVTDQMQTLLEDTVMSVDLTQIGASAIERLLYALDPYESNEAIVSQRRLLKNGTPKNFRMDIKDGFLTLRGKVSIKGIDISMPTIRRLNIAQVPGLKRFEENFADVTPIIAILQKLSARKIIVDKRQNSVFFE